MLALYLSISGFIGKFVALVEDSTVYLGPWGVSDSMDYVEKNVFLFLYQETYQIWRAAKFVHTSVIVFTVN